MLKHQGVDPAGHGLGSGYRELQPVQPGHAVSLLLLPAVTRRSRCRSTLRILNCLRWSSVQVKLAERKA